jgi:hypothetical protein
MPTATTSAASPRGSVSGAADPIPKDLRYRWMGSHRDVPGMDAAAQSGGSEDRHLLSSSASTVHDRQVRLELTAVEGACSAGDVGQARRGTWAECHRVDGHLDRRQSGSMGRPPGRSGPDVRVPGTRVHEAAWRRSGRHRGRGTRAVDPGRPWRRRRRGHPDLLAQTGPVRAFVAEAMPIVESFHFK